MFNVAFIFPGQGAQSVGMGEDFYQNIGPSREIFEQANDLLGFNLTDLIFKGPIERLTDTINCQVAIFTVSIACLRALEAQQIPMKVQYAAGLSLGEYAALVAAGVLDFPQALKLVRLRAQYMEEAAKLNPGGMLCLLGLSSDAAKEISQKAGVEVANLNCPGQVVISGSLSALEQAKQLAQTLGAKKAIPLPVSGAFHSSLMEPARQKLIQTLNEVVFAPGEISVISNVTGRQQDSAQEIRENLARQVAQGTHWEDSIRYISTQGTRRFLEIGPGQVLKGLLRKIDPQLKVDNIGTVEDLRQFRKECQPCC